MSTRMTVYQGTDVITTKTGDKLPSYAAINASSSGANTIVSAVAGKQILVLQYVVVVDGAVTITWESSGGTVHGGPMSFAANGGAAPPFNPVGHFQTIAGEGLVLFLSGAVQVGGHVQYVLV